MKIDKRKSIADQVVALVKEHYLLTHWGEENYHGGVPISEEVKQGYEAIARQLLEDFPAYQQRFAFEDVSRRLKSVVSATVRSGDYSKADVLMSEFWERLDNPDERKVCYH